MPDGRVRRRARVVRAPHLLPGSASASLTSAEMVGKKDLVDPVIGPGVHDRRHGGVARVGVAHDALLGDAELATPGRLYGSMSVIDKGGGGGGERSGGTTHELVGGRTKRAREDVEQLLDDLSHSKLAQRHRSGAKERTGKRPFPLESSPQLLRMYGPKCAKPVSAATRSIRSWAIQDQARCGWKKKVWSASAGEWSAGAAEGEMDAL